MASRVVLLVCALVQLSTAAVEVPGRLVKSSSAVSFSSFAAATEPTCDGFSVYTVCSDCNNVLVCLGSTNSKKNCTATSPTTPYCVNGACSASYDSAGECTPSGVTCTGVGFFPDPKVCQNYHYCEAVGEESSVYECPPNYVYNAETTLCKQKVYATDCVTVKCDESKVFVAYGTSKKYYAFCQFANSVATSIQVLMCPDGYSFDGSNCVFKCPGAGNYGHMDPKKYFQCYYSGSQLIYTIQSCPSGKNYDKDLRVCTTPKTTTTLKPTTTAQPNV
ncbi:uncharacterized protein LOC109398504 [Aedes albopictus]|uniref:Chitin-binding type-2 domain-containing protein n=1 Tax=Aedes albopictus TaxID=7160 RepID=A0ABM1ZG64_AEDAL|nr:uncharacterized protein LOC109398504 [Aedes albopictus]